ncbi:unnamed protein product [Phytophthora fragariaefolia]|uniref:Unnamed protein product n=1 Tax=Phytophthora fragariaefolia TaxID=1490495 RepID=A0A9W7DAD2_9STRA|nr:unnamed protein product [Phytophthora fragariaefolia]
MHKDAASQDAGATSAPPRRRLHCARKLGADVGAEVVVKQDGLGYAMQMVDAWVVAGRPEDFLHWARKAVPTLEGANASGTCMFVALQQAVHLLGESSAVPDAEVESFLTESRKRKVDVSRGLRWKIFRAFLAQLKRVGSCLSFKDLKYNRQRSGHRGVSGIKLLKLEDGFYIVGASNTMGVGHAFVLGVRGRKYTAHAESVKRSLGRNGEWINSLMLVRKVALEA